MAVRVRRGLKADFDPNKLVEGEPAAPLDTRELYIAFAPGDVQKLATHENVREMVDEVTEEVVADLTEGVNNATDYAKDKGDYAKDQGDYAKNQGDYAKDQGDYAKAQGQAAEAVVLGDIATDTTVGVVKGGGNIEIGQDGEMNYDMTGDTKDNTATFTEATADTDIASGETHATIFGKILKSIKTLRYNIEVLTTEKIDKSAIVNQDAINDVSKVPSSAVTYAHGQAITQLNNNLGKLGGKSSYIAGIKNASQNVYTPMCNKWLVAGTYMINTTISLALTGTSEVSQSIIVDTEDQDTLSTLVLPAGSQSLKQSNVIVVSNASSNVTLTVKHTDKASLNIEAQMYYVRLK